MNLTGTTTTALCNAGSNRTKYTYDTAGRVRSLTYPAGESTVIDYDPRSRVIRKTLSAPAHGTVAVVEGSWDLANRQTSRCSA